ncbi:DUF1156 domain-containing protein [Pyrinomonas methylaliphatogenes]|uniref:Adenine-specific DNA methylase containing a Zn-ribbon n=1 Tax=Pyrinomonas methylaliphatogenes TaxID=454194 RepID=A0A0B6WVW2_9BACT|nr:DUF1156 domain-containing protein [Pyrinomonas methylaliphatogenes]CDM64419.1 adenine-specific DNA methylase containing a Zn-ribbon [Pyrinomonas methylaliphatogenes]
MIPKSCKRLAEVDFPIAEVSKHAAREKSIRHGHPSTLHLWWARRPLASCRAVLLGLLFPDPCDPLCPEDFKAKAREMLPRVQGLIGSDDEDLRRALLRFIADFANWDLAANRTYLEIARALVKAAYPAEPPLVVDPFAGGGSIPLEALRVGCEAFASDLNPVACLILKVMLEEIPRHGPGLAEELRRVGAEIKREAEKELAELYPKDEDGAVPIAYLWARTVRCEAPNCGAEIPLVRSFWLCKRASRKRALRPRVERPEGQPPRVEFEIFEPKSEREVSGGTVSRARATCLCCRAVLTPERVRAQLAAQRGGADVVFDEKGQRTGGARLLAVVTLKPGESGRHYRLPTERDYQAVCQAQKRLKAILDEWEREKGKRQKEKGKNQEAGHTVFPFSFSLLPSLCPVPDEPTPAGGGSGAGRAFSVQKYGMLQWGDLFTARQKVALVTLARLARERPGADGEAVRAAMAVAISKQAERLSSLVSWISSTQAPRGTFARQALPIVWDFLEMVPVVNEEEFPELVEAMADVVELFALTRSHTGQVQPADATEHPLPDETAHVWFTDPPYYDAVPYADLSDFFLVWLKRALPGHPLLRDPFDPTNPLTPKTREAVQNERSETEDGRPKDRAFYEEAMAKAFAEGRRVLREDGIGSVVFAHKTTEGWEALLSGMIRGGWTITGSWPIATERPGRLRSQESAALATSVHLICRPRPEDAPVGDWGDVLRELPQRVSDWMERLQGEGIRGADLVFACIGPALEIFSRFSRVETAEGREVKLEEFLEKVWEAVGRAALTQVLGVAEARSANGSVGALEEDARLTALFLWTLQSTEGEDHHRDAEGAEEDEGLEDLEDEDSATSVVGKGFSLPFDVVRRFAQPLGIDLPRWEERIIKTERGMVRLLPLPERAEQLLGKDGGDRRAIWGDEDSQKKLQQALFQETEEPPQRQRKRRGNKKLSAEKDSPLRFDGEEEVTTLDRVHTAMLLQSSGQSAALRGLLKAEMERGPDFLRLANALSALYPKGSEEKRLVDAMLLAVPR